jgi:hypothetical protein
MPDYAGRGGPVSESPLRQALEAAATETGCSLKDLTVLAVQRDPFRLDTPANHALGEWLASIASSLGLGRPQTAGA